MSQHLPVHAPSSSARTPFHNLATLLGRVEGGLWVTLAFCLPVLVPLVRPGLGDMADGTLHVFRTVELARLWGEGILYSRWAPDLAFGLGYPLYNFYSPLFYYLAGAFTLPGLNVELAVKLTLAVIVMAGAAGMYGLARLWTGPIAAALAAIAFTWAPFRLRELYFQGDFPQALALAFLPIALWAMHRLAETGRDRYLAGLALAVAGLFLSHSITTMLSSPFVVGYLLFLLLCLPAARRNLPRLVLGLLLGVGLSAFFFWPALAEMPLVRLDNLHSGDFDFRRHFMPAWELFSLPVPLDASAVNPEQRFTLGLVHVLAAVPSLLALRVARLRLATAMGWLALGGGVLMMLPESTPLWQAIPLIAFTEFPWRWLGVSALPLAILAGLGLQALPRRARVVYCVFVVLAIAWSMSPHLYPREPFVPFGNATVADMVRDELKTQAIGTTSTGEYLPRAVVTAPNTSPLVPAYLEGKTPERLDRTSLPAGARVTTVDARPLSLRWQIDAPAAFAARVYTFNFLGWVAYLDGNRVAPETSLPDGFIVVRVPPGPHELALRFEDTDQRRLANGVSIVVAVLFAGILLVRRFRARSLPEVLGGERTRDAAGSPDSGPMSGRLAAGLVGVAFALLVLKVAYIDPRTTLFRAASDLDRIPGLEEQMAVNFDDKIALLGYSVDKRVAAPGETVRVVLFWRALRPMQETYASFLHLGDERNDKLAQKDSPLPAQVPMQSWRLNQFARDEHLLTIPEDIPPGIFDFRVGLYKVDNLERPMVKDAPVNYALLKEPLRIVGGPPANATRANYRLGDDIRLAGYRIPAPSVRPGEEVDLHLYWQSVNDLEIDYTVFVHAYDRAGKLWGTGDSQPLSGKYPTSRWAKGEVVGDLQRVRLDPQAPPGEYVLAIGLYDLKTMQRLPVADADGKPLADGVIRLAPALKAVGP
jgi:hypothetical protein